MCLHVREYTKIEEFELERDSGAALSFKGECLAKAASSDNNASGSLYSGRTGRWQGERDSHHANVCANNGEVIEFFGHNRLAVLRTR